MTRPRTKRELAEDHIEQALSSTGKALSLLGGRTRALSVRKDHRVFTVRKYLESIENRLRVCADLLALSNASELDVVQDARDTVSEMEKAFPNLAKVPKDEFERQYDRERKITVADE